MKSKIILVVILLISLVLGITLVSNATDELQARTSINTEDMVGEDVNYDDQIDLISLDPEDYGEEIPVENFQRGDVYVLENNASVESYIDGNLYILADNVDVSSYVDGNVFAMGTNVTIKGDITGSLFAIGENVNFLSGYAKDVYFYAENVLIGEDATISREAKMMGETVTISAPIDGDAYTRAEKVIVTDSATITGKLVYSGELSKATEDQIGSIEKQEIKLPEKVSSQNTFANKAEKVLFKTITALIIIGLIVLASNRKAEGKITIGGSLKGLLAGLGWIVLIPIIVLLLILTVVGVPAALILLTIYILMYFVAIPAVSLQISAYILNIKNKYSKVLLWLLAVVIYCAFAIVRLIPSLGFIITILLGTYGFNLILKTIFSNKKKEVKDEPVVE